MRQNAESQDAKCRLCIVEGYQTSPLYTGRMPILACMYGILESSECIFRMPKKLIFWNSSVMNAGSGGFWSWCGWLRQGQLAMLMPCSSSNLD